MLAGKTSNEFTNLFSPNNWFFSPKDWWYNSKLFCGKCLKIAECSSAECNSIEHDFYKKINLYPDLSATLLSHQQQFRLKNSMKIKIIFLLRLKKEN